MKSFILSLTLLASFSTFASEVSVLEVSALEAGKGSLSTRFEVDLQNDSVGVSVKVTKRSGSFKNPYTTSRSFEKTVPELSLNGKTLEFSKDGKVINCGTMGVTSILNVPTLRLSGNCDLVAKRADGKVIVSIITE